MLPLVAMAQINLEAGSGRSGNNVQPANSGYKFYVMDVLAQQCMVYNPDYSLWETIDLEVPADHYL